MASKNQQIGYAESTAIQTEDSIDIKPVRVTPDMLTAVVERVVSSLDVDLDVIQRSVDQGLMLGVDKMREILATSDDPDLQVKAMGAVTSVANHVVKRRQVQTMQKGSIQVLIGNEHLIPGANPNPPENLLDEPSADEGY